MVMIFLNTPTTFALSSNVPIPQDYILGPGDKIELNILEIIKESHRSFYIKKWFFFYQFRPNKYSRARFEKQKKL